MQSCRLYGCGSSGSSASPSAVGSQAGSPFAGRHAHTSPRSPGKTMRRGVSGAAHVKVVHFPCAYMGCGGGELLPQAGAASAAARATSFAASPRPKHSRKRRSASVGAPEAFYKRPCINPANV